MPVNSSTVQRHIQHRRERLAFIRLGGFSWHIVPGLFIALALALPAFCSGVSTAQEQQVKAAFLINFAKFIDWPAEAQILTFCVAGDQSMEAFLETASVGKSVGSRQLKVRSAGSATSLSDCNIVYLGRSEKKKAPQMAQLLSGKRVLTVSEFCELGADGIVFNFFIEQERVRFEVNLGAAARANLKISSQLLKLARIVPDKQ